MGRLESRRAELEAKGGRLAAVSVDPVGRSRALADKLGLGFPVLADTAGTVARAYGVWHASAGIALPSVIVVDPKGAVRWRRVSESVMDRPGEDELIAAVAAATR